MNEFIAANALQVLTIVFIAGGFYWQGRNAAKRLDASEKRHEYSDMRVHEQESRIIRLEEKMKHHEGLLKEIRETVREILQQLMKGER